MDGERAGVVTAQRDLPVGVLTSGSGTTSSTSGPYHRHQPGRVQDQRPRCTTAIRETPAGGCGHQAAARSFGLASGLSVPRSCILRRRASMSSSHVLKRSARIALASSSWSGELVRNRPESAAVGALLEGVGVDEGVAPPDQAVVRVQPSNPLGFPFDDLLTAQRDDRVHQRALVGEVPVQLGLAGACSRPDVVQGGGVHALPIREIGRRMDDAVPGYCSPGSGISLRGIVTSAARRLRS
jgi:hypothetical protein